MRATASSSSTRTARNIVHGRIEERSGSLNKVTIHNHSQRDIFLIPVVCQYGEDSTKTSYSQNGNKKTIPKESSEVVELDKVNYNSALRPQILFHAAVNDYGDQKILEEYHKKGGEKERLYTLAELKSKVLHLQYDEVDPDTVKQINSMRDLIMDIKAKQEKLKEVVEDLIMDQTDKQAKLKEDVEDLLKKTDDLNVALTAVEHSCTH